jgi:acetyl esterase/lipase
MKVGGVMTHYSRRDFGRLGAAAAITLGLGDAVSAATGAAPAQDPLAYVDPEMRPAARKMLSSPKGPPLDRNYLDIRKSIRDNARTPRPDIPVARHEIAVPGGAPSFSAFVINAKPGASRPAILHTHGGGYVFGNAGSEIVSRQDIAKDLDCVVVTVDYRLAPEARYQASIEENYAALKWLFDHAEALGVDRSRIAVMGESAGGGHAALLALTARDRGEVPLVLQLLVYPMLDDRTGSSRMPPPHIGRIGWSADDNRFGWGSFLGQAPGTRTVPAAAVPARARTLAGLPPAFIGVGSIDLFVEEDVDYARRLIDSGVATELIVVPGAFHGFDDNAPEASLTRQFTAAKMAALRRAFTSSG